jgi:hypothetical protein
MPRIGYLLLLPALWLVSGCCPTLAPRTPAEEAMFGPARFRIHPAFTQIKNWSHGPKLDGVDAVVEFQDTFGEPTRATGTLRFELYTIRPSEPDHRGVRIASWSGALATRDDQIAHWDAATRGYNFQLAFDKIQKDHAYVLTAQFNRNGTRLFDQLILEPSVKEGYHGDRRTQHAPSNAPGHGITY